MEYPPSEPAPIDETEVFKELERLLVDDASSSLSLKSIRNQLSLKYGEGVHALKTQIKAYIQSFMFGKHAQKDVEADSGDHSKFPW